MVFLLLSLFEAFSPGAARSMMLGPNQRTEGRMPKEVSN